jgi:hypothetical protein
MTYKPLQWNARLLTAIFIMTLSAPSGAFARHGHLITCESYDGDYKYCRVHTGGHVRLKKRLSHHRCRENKNWGYDSHGIWVDDGCRAEFLVNYSSHSYQDEEDYSYDDDYDDYKERHKKKHHHKHKSNVGAALGVAAGVAVLGALIAATSSSDTSSSSSSHYEARHQSSVPSWLVGTYQGFDPASGSEEQLTIMPSGQIMVKAGGSNLAGYIDSRGINIQGKVYQATRSDKGIVLTNEANSRDIIHLFRIR